MLTLLPSLSVLSAFEESSVACIYDLLRHISTNTYLDAILMAEKLILHVEVLFGAIDDLDWISVCKGVKGGCVYSYHPLLCSRDPARNLFTVFSFLWIFYPINLLLSSSSILFTHSPFFTGMAHIHEARMLCQKIIGLFNFFHEEETGARHMDITQELLAKVTDLAYYLKILIRIALIRALKLERRETGGSEAEGYQQQQYGMYKALTTANGAPPLAQGEVMASFLDTIHLLAVQGGNPAARRMTTRSSSESSSTKNPSKHVRYGFRSLAPENAGNSPFWSGAASSSGSSRSANGRRSSSDSFPSDLCVRCGLTIVEDCVRLGTYQRWHAHCVQCAHCGKIAAVPVPQTSGQTPPQRVLQGRKDDDRGSSKRDQRRTGNESGSQNTSGNNTTSTIAATTTEATVNGKDTSTSASTSTPHPVLKLTTLRCPPAHVHEFVYDPDSLRDTPSFGEVPAVILCTVHARPGCKGGFQVVEWLEQYAFLLNVALRWLYLLWKKEGALPMLRGESCSIF